MSAVVCPSGIKPVLRLGAHLGCVTRTMLGAVVHLTGFAECSAKHCFLFLNLTVNEWTSSDWKLQLWLPQIWHQKCCSLSIWGVFSYFQRCRCLPGPDTNGSCLCLQDAVPPELVRVLQNSKDPLLQKLFPVTEKNQNNTKTQNRAAVVTVVSKFKVHPIQVSAVILETFWIYHQQFDESIHGADFLLELSCSSALTLSL